jgi:4-diphosphocytidyl-2-C-methyl-D-erythritol kinase
VDKNNNKKNRISIEAPAKINLFLEVLGKRNDGYHEIETVMQEIDLVDSLEFEEIDEGIKLECENSGIPLNNTNLVYKAAELVLRECGITNGVLVRLEKRIPVGAGLGGGSSDAAATLKALNSLWGIGLNDIELMELAAKLGSDVAFFIKGKTSLCRGRGEKVYPIEVKGEFNYLVVFPNVEISTTLIYGNLKIDLTKNRKDVSFFAKAMESFNVVNIGKLLYNRLEETIFSLYPNLLQVKNLLECFDFCGLLVSGSGSAIYGLCRNRKQAEMIRNQIEFRGIGKVFVAANTIKPQTTR